MGVPQACPQLVIAAEQAKLAAGDGAESGEAHADAAEEGEPVSQRLGVAGSAAAEADFQCAACQELLVRPAVLTCGHAVCSTCLLPEAGPPGACPQCDMPVVCRPRTCKLVHPSPPPLLIQPHPMVHALKRLFQGNVHIIHPTFLSPEVRRVPQLASGPILAALVAGPLGPAAMPS